MKVLVEPSTDGDVYASQSTLIFVPNPKQDLHGFGYDRFKHAPEFRERKRLRISGNREPGNRRGSSMKENLFSSKSGKVAPGFGIGALEELDAEDEDVYASGFDFVETHVQEIEEPSRMLLEYKKKPGKTEEGVLLGFKVASNSDYQLEGYGPPVIPDDFEPYHKFPGALEIGNKLPGPPPPEVPLPEDNNLRVSIEGFAALVLAVVNYLRISPERRISKIHCFVSLMEEKATIIMKESYGRSSKSEMIRQSNWWTRSQCHVCRR